MSVDKAIWKIVELDKLQSREGPWVSWREFRLVLASMRDLDGRMNEMQAKIDVHVEDFEQRLAKLEGIFAGIHYEYKRPPEPEKPVMCCSDQNCKGFVDGKQGKSWKTLEAEAMTNKYSSAPSGYWFINTYWKVQYRQLGELHGTHQWKDYEKRKAVGNCFSTEAEAREVLKRCLVK